MGALKRGVLGAALLLLCCPARAQETSAVSAITPGPPLATVTLTAVGDMRLDGPVGELITRQGLRAPLAAASSRLRADIVLGNLECPVTRKGRKAAQKSWSFRAPARNLKALKAGGFNLLALANNHLMDYGPRGLRDTLAALAGEGLAFVGAGRDRAEAERVRVLTVRGLRVGFLAFTSTYPRTAWAGPRRAGVAYSDFSRAAGLIRRARAGCDALVVSFHGGTEKSEEPNEVQRAFARLCIDAGADLFIGHHPHVIQPVELYRDKPILHSLGNFLFVSPSPATRPTVAARVTLSRRGVERVEFIPFDTGWGRPVPAPPEESRSLRAVLDRGGALSAQPERLRMAAE